MAKLIDEESAKQVKAEFESKMKGVTEVILFVSDIVPPDNPQLPEINNFGRQLLSDLNEIEPRVKYRETTLQSEEAKLLGVSVSPSFAIGYDEGYRIVYSGAPLGHEATGFIETIIAVSGKESGLSKESMEMLSKIEKPVNIKVFVTPTCPYCPKSVIAANKIAIAAKGKVTAICVESMENRELSMKFNVSSVPQQVINDDPESTSIGALPEHEFVMQALKYGAPGKYEGIVKEREAAKKSKEKLADSPSEPVFLTDNNLDSALKKYENLVVDCWAEWCMPCKMLAPVIDELANENAGRITFGKLNVDENPAKAGEYGIMSIPTLLVFRNGEKKGEVVGVVPKAELLKKINELLK